MSSPAPAAPAEAPPSVCVPSSDILGDRAKAGEVDQHERRRAYVTWIYFVTGHNKAETARLTGFHRRTVTRWIDPVRLARLLQREPPPDKTPGAS
jgi:hypothetical protein